MTPEKRVLIIVPAFNEEGSIQKVIGGVREHFPQADIIVVNDGSTDCTSERARAGMATVLDLPFNLGIGGAMQAGYRYAYEKGYDMAIQVDGDGQHDPAEISKLLDALETEKVDMVIGSRFIGNSNSEYKPALMRKFGISILSRVISSIVGQKISDPTSGFRVANRRTIELFAFNYPQDYPEPEVLVLLHRCDLKMKEIPVAMSGRASGESSITKFRSIYYMVKVLLAIFVDCFKTSHSRDRREEDP
jgi:glycosyltransferase involved in cell wall biosynthesis